jgi:hypothetical protein
MADCVILSMPFRQAGLGGGCVTEIPAGVPVAFEDPDAVAALIALGIATLTREPAQKLFTRAEVDFDPRTVFGPGFGSRQGELVIAASRKSMQDYTDSFEVRAS